MNEEETTKIVTKSGGDLTDGELSQVKEAIFREFKVSFNIDDISKDRLFFLLKKEETILAMGALWEVKPVIFNGDNFIVYGVLNVVSNIKGKGYGKKIVTTMREYLATRNKTIMGFCMPKNTEFYKKCGFKIDTSSTKRFVYTKEEQGITNQDGQFIFYQDSTDNFMKKVLVSPDKEVSIPSSDLW